MTPDVLPIVRVLPVSWPTLLRLIWTHVSFPGNAPEKGTARLASLFWLLLVPGLLLYPSLDFHLFEPDEGRYAEIPREMLAHGDWIVPHLQGLPYLDKPPLVYWFIMLSYQLFGVADWSARLVPALAVHGCVLITYLLGRRIVGERAAFWGALILGLAPGFLSVGRLLLLDGFLSLWVTLEIFCAFEAVRDGRLKWNWWLAAATACGLGVLTKGPVAVLLLLPPLGAYTWLSKKGTGANGINLSRFLSEHAARASDDLPLARAACSRNSLPLCLAAYLGVALGVALPWFVAISLRRPEFPRYFFWEHNVVRFSTGFDHLRPVWFYLPIVIGGLLPGSLLLFGFGRFLVASDEATARRRCPELGFLLLAGGWCVLFFTLSECKLPTYVLPAFPPLALALGYYLVNSEWAASRWPTAIAATAFVLLAIGHHMVLPYYARHHSPFRDAEQMVHYCGDPATPVVCYPRNCDSVSFYLGRDDLRTFRGKQTPELIEFLKTQPRTVVLCMHRNSLETLRRVLPPQLGLAEERPLCGSARPGLEGLCWMAVVKRR